MFLHMVGMKNNFFFILYYDYGVFIVHV